jgi:hypothetical protein
LFGGLTGIRTPDPLLAKQMLYQLSYQPVKTAKNALEFYFLVDFLSNFCYLLRSENRRKHAGPHEEYEEAD